MVLRQRKPPSPTSSPMRSTKDKRTHEAEKSSSFNQQGCAETGEIQFRLLRERPSWLRLDVFPFALVYMGIVALENSHITVVDTVVFNLSVTSVLFAVALLLQLVIVVGSMWSPQFRASIGYADISERDGIRPNTPVSHCFVKSLNASPSGIVEVGHTDTALQIRFQDKVYRCNYHSSEKGETIHTDHDYSLWGEVQSSENLVGFRSLFYPDSMPLSFYTKWNGHAVAHSAITAAKIYGSNTTALELPTLLDLVSQQLAAPFFLFQIVCCGLWSLDEYWYYAFVTLGMLILFETVTAYNRLQSLQRLHSVSEQHIHQRVMVKRYPGSHWINVARAELVPGDWIRLGGAGSSVPADILLMAGTAVVDEALLTGESVPQLKQALDAGNEELDLRLDVTAPEHKESILFGGTVLVTTHADAQGIVLRTGFETAQGSLLRTMAHGTHHVSASHQRDTAVFISTLFICGIIAGAYVVNAAWHDDRRNRFRLLLHVILLITSTVPPELPLELSLAVTHAVQALQKRCAVFCTEPNRIPVAGQVTVCCFDKTGTLTSDMMELQGLTACGIKESVSEEELLTESWPTESLRIMAACHSLVGSSHHLIGDPLEQAVFVPSGYRLDSRDRMVHDVLPAITVIHRFPFMSKLKRMSVVATVGNGTFVLTKGAPETVRELLSSNIPSNYEATAFYHMSKGRRVLAMAWKEIPSVKKKPDRKLVEQGLTFAGFIVLQCPLKPDTKSVIRELHKSGHRTTMITGDALLTAAEVARQVGIADRKQQAFEIRKCKTAGQAAQNPLSMFECVAMTSKDDYDNTKLNLSRDYETLVQMKTKKEAFFCLSGNTLLEFAQATELSTSTTDEKKLLANANLVPIVRLVSVFARHAPHHKEAIVTAFNESGERTLMCGDGTNDVGALKSAHVGISIISAPEIEAKQREATSQISTSKEAKGKAKKTKKKKARNLEESLRQLQEAQDELDRVELGDASVAAPFTSRALSIRCCKDVIQQGRCTLVTMLQIYKILGINCLVNALVLSKLFLHGVKQGDRQLTILGMGVAALFYFVTRAEPLPKLAEVRPPSTVLCAQAFLSIAGQCAIHLGTILLATDVALSFVDSYDPSLVPDGPFNPNVLNTCTFLLTCLSVTNTFAVNYRGEPFMKSLRENKLFYRSLMVCYGSLFVCALEIFPPLNDLLQLTTLPSINDVDSNELSAALRSVVEVVDFPVFFCGLMVLNTCMSFICEKLLLDYFESKQTRR